MSEQIREQISAFLDGELSDSETPLLLKRLARDADLREVFGRYALVADVVRSPDGGPVMRGFVSRVNLQIDAEPAATPAVATVARARRWWRPLTGAAVAAGVAAFAVVTLEHRTGQPLQASAVTPHAASAAAATASAAAAPVAKRVATLAAGPFKPREDLSYTVPTVSSGIGSPLPAARLTNYVFAHSKYSSSLGQRNVLSGLVTDQSDELADDQSVALFPPDSSAPSSALSVQP